MQGYDDYEEYDNYDNYDNYGESHNYGEAESYGYVGLDSGYAAARDWCQLRFNIIKTADEEQGAWLDASGALRSESDPAVLDMLVKYWRDGVGQSAAGARQTATQSAADTTPWSAAFISWVMRNAGIQRSDGFWFSQRHIVYIVEAMRNRERNDTTKPFWLYDISEQAQHPVVAGDLICFNRKPRGKAKTTHSYTKLKRKWWDVVANRTKAATGYSHTDVVIGFHDRGGKRYLEAIGGNRGNTVGSVELEVDANNQILSPGDVFGILKLTECPNG